jgi:hypothetical protein
MSRKEKNANTLPIYKEQFVKMLNVVLVSYKQSGKSWQTFVDCRIAM